LFWSGFIKSLQKGKKYHSLKLGTWRQRMLVRVISLSVERPMPWMPPLI
jgi:hypothetical protein